MKKSIQLIVVSFLTTLALSCQNGPDANKDALASVTNEEASTSTSKKTTMKVFDDFIYEVGTRFSPIKKSEIDQAKTIADFIKMEEVNKMEVVETVNVILVKDDKQTKVKQTGTTKELTDAQLRLLQSFNYSTNFVLRVDFKEKNMASGVLENNYTSPHLTIVPEKQATFVDGKDAIKRFLKYETEEVRKNVDPEKLKPAKLYFTVANDGSIKNVYLDRSSGYPEVDKKVQELITKVPGTWLPAENTKGEKVDQELVVSFGLIGC